MVAAAVVLSPPPTIESAQAASHQADLDFLVDQIAAHYAYLPDCHLDLVKFRAIYDTKAKKARSEDAFLQVVEEAVGELHDHHATLGVNNDASPQLIPTGTELWGEIRNGRAILSEVRPHGAAAKAGLRSGDEVVAFGAVPTAKAIALAAPKALAEPDLKADEFTLRTLLAGTHEGERELSVRGLDGRIRVTRLSPYIPTRKPDLTSWHWIKPGLGYIRIENSLGDSETVKAFDAALNEMKGVKGLILDLRDTPSGGSTDVAEPILGRFILKPSAYQRVFDPSPGKVYPKDSWLKTVSPRGPQIKAKLVVLVDHWTGSMGEGMAIGLDALHRAKIVGTPMAGLLGGTGEFILPNSKIPVDFPIERLYQVNGEPRESFVPQYRVELVHETEDDAILATGIKVLDAELSSPNPKSRAHL